MNPNPEPIMPVSWREAAVPPLMILAVLTLIVLTQSREFMSAKPEPTQDAPAKVKAEELVAVPQIPKPEPDVAAPASAPVPVPVAPEALPEPIVTFVKDEAAVRRWEEERAELAALAERQRERTATAWKDAGRSLASALWDLAARATEAKTKKRPGIADENTVTTAYASVLVQLREKADRLRQEQDQARNELQRLKQAPKPASQPLSNHNPYAKPPVGDEFHFEVRGDRVGFIDLEKLLEAVKTDARVRMRIAAGPKPIEGEVGPVNGYRLHYLAGPDPDQALTDLLDRRGVTITLLLWEVAPVGPIRGETYATALHPASQFTRAISKLNPTRDAVTLWVYPDGFALYRQLRDLLQSRGFTVAARPLPNSIPIRGSPRGSRSAAQ